MFEKLQVKLKLFTQTITYYQKGIRVADQSRFGWATFEEYDRDGLTSDSDSKNGFLKLRGTQSRHKKEKMGTLRSIRDNVELRYQTNIQPHHNSQPI